MKLQAGARVAWTHFEFVNRADGPQNLGLPAATAARMVSITPMASLIYQITPDDMVTRPTRKVPRQRRQCADATVLRQRPRRSGTDERLTVQVEHGHELRGRDEGQLSWRVRCQQAPSSSQLNNIRQATICRIAASVHRQSRQGGGGLTCRRTCLSPTNSRSTRTWLHRPTTPRPRSPVRPPDLAFAHGQGEALLRLAMERIAGRAVQHDGMGPLKHIRADYAYRSYGTIGAVPGTAASEFHHVARPGLQSGLGTRRDDVRQPQPRAVCGEHFDAIRS